jgi:hypothetical protein
MTQFHYEKTSLGEDLSLEAKIFDYNSCCRLTTDMNA